MPKKQFSRTLSIALVVVCVLIVASAVTPRALAASKERVLHSFGPGNGGHGPIGVIFDAAGNLFGVTPYGGAYDGGTVFELLPDGNSEWNHKVLYNFCSVSNCVDGDGPSAGLILDSSGNL